MKHINFSIIFLALVSFLLSFTAHSEIKEYTGIVISLHDEKQSATTNAYDRGWVDYSARLGQIVKPTVYNSKGEIVIPGDILIYGNSTAWDAYVKGGEVQLEASRKLMKIAYDIYSMYLHLSNKQAAALQSITLAKAGLADAIGDYRNNITVLEAAKLAAVLPTVRTSFEGIVTAVTQGSGSCLGGANVLEVVQLNPIGIQLNIPVADQMKITQATPIKIYLKGMDKELGSSYIYSYMAPNSLVLVTDNYPIIEKNTIIPNNGIKVLREWLPVVNFDFISARSKTLAVPLFSLQKDEKGTFVWRAKGQKVMQVDKGIDYTFPIEKVYVAPGDKIRYQTTSTKLISLKDKGTLNRYDLVLNNPPPSKYDVVLHNPIADLKDGETVVYPQQAYLLMPGDEVKVVIGNNTNNTIKTDKNISKK